MAREVTHKELENKAWIVVAATLAFLLLPIIGVWFIKFVHWYAKSLFMWF